MVARRAYVPSTSESKDSGGRGWVVAEKGGGWVKGSKNRMKRERRPDQTQEIKSRNKRGKKVTLSGLWVMYNKA